MRMVIRNWTPVIHAAALAIALALLATVTLMWAWNTLGHDLLGAPKAQFKHALAFLVGVVVVGLVMRRGRR